MSKEKKMAMDILDEKEGRIRLYRDEFEDFISLYASVKMIGTCLAKIERLARKLPRTWPKVKCGYTLLYNSVVAMTTKISVHQYKMLKTNNGAIVFQHSKEYARYSMAQDDYYRLVVAARIGSCANCMMCMSRGEWSKCQIMKTLDTVPCRQGIHEKDQFDRSICPYAIIDPDEFKETARRCNLK